MKNIFIFFISGFFLQAQAGPVDVVTGVLGTTSACYALNESLMPQPAQLQGYWKLDGAVSALFDSTVISATVGTDGAVVGPGASRVSGAKMNQGLSSSTNDTGINIGDGSQYDYGLTSFTVSYWVKFPTGTDNPQWTMGKGNAFNGGTCTAGGGAGTGGWGVAHWMTLDPVTPQLVLSDGSTCLFSPGGVSLKRGQWGHFAVRIDRSSQVASFFVNGAKVTMSIASLGSISNTAGSYRYFTIGRGAGSYMNATVDEVGIWNVALSDAEIKRIYDQQSCGSN